MECAVNTKEIRFDLYCDKCKHVDVNETDDPCNKCLTQPMGMGTVKPVCFEEKED